MTGTPRWRTCHPKSRWCGATSSFLHSNGNEINLICTRFAEHLTHPKSKDPLKHFDELRRQHWYDEGPPAIDRPSGEG